ncbi:MAG TPA: penicillin-binding protein [Vicinamibacterales bacterium]|jgi:cell division protein FtsI (penicillin-binding protein 3)
MAEEARTDWRRTLKRRMVLLAVLWACWAVGIEARLVVLQVVEHTDLQARAERQQLRTQPAPAERGDILDRNGRVLAVSVEAESLYAVPNEISRPKSVARDLCGALGDCTPEDLKSLVDRLSQPRAFTYVRRLVSPEVVRRVEALNLEGVGFLQESRRFYPNRQLAAHVVGYVGIDNVGLGGIEAVYDSKIRGRAGMVLIQTDARRHAFSRLERPPTTGATVELTIDEYLQHIAERELHRGVVDNNAEGGTAIIMDPRTGEILALANEPTFNPNTFQEASPVARRDRAVQDVYEPGSTFKIVTASAALEDHVWSVNDIIDTRPGTIRIGSRIVHDTADHGVLTFPEFLIESSNVAAIKIGMKLGADRLGEFVKRFGFGQELSPDFAGQSAGIVWNPDNWTDSALASVSMGYQIGVTPLQMITAASVVANGGLLMEPRVVRAFYANGRWLLVPHHVVRRAISAQTAATLVPIMEGVVDRGTAKAAQIPGYTIAGKTGTAAKLVNGHYSKSDYNASFVGFLPSRNPALAILVVIDSPHGHGYYGGSVSAPVFKQIAEAALQYLGVGPTIDPRPPVIVTTSAPSSPAPVRPQVVDVSSTGSGLPDLTGLSARDAMQALAHLGMTAQLSGDGTVVAQDPAPGVAIEPGAVCRLTLKRLPKGTAVDRQASGGQR